MINIIDDSSSEESAEKVDEAECGRCYTLTHFLSLCHYFIVFRTCYFTIIPYLFSVLYYSICVLLAHLYRTLWPTPLPIPVRTVCASS